MNLNFNINRNALNVIETLQKNGYHAYIVGGAVRDHLLGITPKDYDIVTDAHPPQVKKVFGRSARIIGRRFKLVHVRRGRECYEVSTFRRTPEAHERMARDDDDGVTLWRDNEYGTETEDAFRRDFTVNALMYDPTAENPLIDHIDGLKDLQDGIVRAIGEPALRLAEDPVRILRALKLVGQYDFKLEPALEKAIREQATTIHNASQARLFEELLKIFAKPYFAKTIDAFADHGFLQHFLPNVSEVWRRGETGKLMRSLMQERDRRKLEGTYWLSRRLALATLALPVVNQAVTGSDKFEWWEYEPGMDKQMRRQIRHLLEPLQTPKMLSQNVAQVIELLPGFTSQDHRKRILRSPHYRWARELFSLLAAALGWDAALLDDWPRDSRPQSARQRRHPHHTRQKHVKRSHKKEWEDK